MHVLCSMLKDTMSPPRSRYAYRYYILIALKDKFHIHSGIDTLVQKILIVQFTAK